jgi:hypothetical protein
VVAGVAVAGGTEPDDGRDPGEVPETVGGTEPADGSEPGEVPETVGGLVDGGPDPTVVSGAVVVAATTCPESFAVAVPSGVAIARRPAYSPRVASSKATLIVQCSPGPTVWSVQASALTENGGEGCTAALSIMSGTDDDTRTLTVTWHPGEQDPKWIGLGANEIGLAATESFTAPPPDAYERRVATTATKTTVRAANTNE